MKFTRKNRAFTLIELLVVVLIIAILTAIALPLYLKSVENAEESACKADMKMIAVAEQSDHVRNRALDYWGSAATGIAPGDTALNGRMEDLQNQPICPGDGASFYVVVGTATNFTISCLNPDHSFTWADGKFTP